MTSGDLGIWGVLHSQFVGAGSESGIGFALINVPEAQESCNVRKNNGRNGLRNRSIEA